MPTRKDLDGGCFHLTDPEPMRIGEILNMFAKAAHAPQMTMRLERQNVQLHAELRFAGLDERGPGAPRRATQILTDLGIPEGCVQLHQLPDQV